METPPERTRRRITVFLWSKRKIGRRTRWLTFATIIQERAWVLPWRDIAWDDDDVPRDLSEYLNENELPPKPLVHPIEDQEWGEGQVAKGAYTIERELPARSCTFAIWHVSGSDHPKFARVYGRGNADRITSCLTACDGMLAPTSEVADLKDRPASLLEALQRAEPEEVARALLEVSRTREGFAYDVGEALFEANARKETPDADPRGGSNIYALRGLLP